MIIFGFLGFLTCLKVGASDSQPLPTITKLSVQIGDAVSLPCDASFYVNQRTQGEVEKALRWEVMGDDVAFLQAGMVTEGLGYEQRVELPSLERVMEGDFSLTLSRAVLRDADMYECIWQGQRTIATVWLTVNYNPIIISQLSYAGDSVNIPCYGLISKSQDLSHVSVRWTRDGNHILGLRNSLLSFDTEDSSRRLSMETHPINGNLTLNIYPVLLEDQGMYECSYNSGRYNERKKGMPESVHLAVYSAVTTGAEETNVSTTTLMMWSDNGHVQVTSSQSVGGLVETTSSPKPDMEDPDEWLPLDTVPLDTVPLHSVPWVRIGIIGGVLLVTALVLGVLLAMHKI